MNLLAGVRDLSFGSLGAAGGYSAVKPPVSSVTTLPLVRMQTQAELSEIRATYQTAEGANAVAEVGEFSNDKSRTPANKFNTR